jgi:hypothetical protein
LFIVCGSYSVPTQKTNRNHTETVGSAVAEAALLVDAGMVTAAYVDSRMVHHAPSGVSRNGKEDDKMVDIVFTEITNVQTIGTDNKTKTPYWQSEDVVDLPFEQVAAVVQDYLADLQVWLTWAPLCDTRWELVGFHPEYATAVLDSVYATPVVAKAVMKESSQQSR